MTEDEAKTKWCPYIQIAVCDEGIADNRGNGGETFNCIASKCMAWEENDPVTVWDDGHMSIYREGDEMARNFSKKIENQGYCGLTNRS